MSSPNGDAPLQLDIPVVELGTVKLAVSRAPADPSKRAFFIGPVILQVSFDDDAAKVLVRALTGIELPTMTPPKQL